MNITTARLRYTQILIIVLLGVFLYVTTQSLAGGISQFEGNLWGRRFLVTSFTRLRLKLGDRVFPQVLVGKEGWLEYLSVRNLDGYQNAIETPPGSVENAQQKLQQLYDKFRQKNITLILVVAPNKATIYPDKLPDEIQKLAPQSKLDVFTTYIQQHGPPVLVDLRPALQDGRKKQDVYYKTDTHWNPYGVFIAYREIMKELSKTYPQLAPKSINDFKITTTGLGLHDLPQIMGATNLMEPGIKIKLKEGDMQWAFLNDDQIAPLQISTTPKEDLPSLLIYVDSFGIYLRDFIAPHFSKTTVMLIHSKYPDALSPNIINIIKPDIVIVEIVERSFNIQNLDAFLNQQLSERK